MPREMRKWAAPASARVPLAQRFAQWHLALHPHKTRIVYCKDANRRGSYPDQRFDFLGYTFRPCADGTFIDPGVANQIL